MSEATIFSRLLEETERVTQIGAREILGNSRLKPIVVARKIFWCALRMAGFSTPAIADKVHRNHTTVATRTRRSPVEIRDMAAVVCLKSQIEPMDFSEWSSTKKKKYNLSENAPVRMKKVPDYKNNCVKWMEVW